MRWFVKFAASAAKEDGENVDLLPKEGDAGLAPVREDEREGGSEVSESAKASIMRLNVGGRSSLSIKVSYR